MSNVIVLGLSGPSCSGKTTLALSLIKLIPNTVVIHQDNYYKNDDLIPVDCETEQQDWDCPAAFDMEKLSRREAREGYATKDGVWTDPPGYFDSIVWPNFTKYNSGFVTRFPEILSDDVVQMTKNSALGKDENNEPSYWNNKVVICSSDMPAGLALGLCTRLVLAEWQQRRSGFERGDDN
ncbi:ribosylnicotinamide kinase [Coemansia interrupta]|uniref:Ribosylnicotinamide kinase n=1 Tax=Coemansia interrupta TaxID=1126814 RepID=A0A9W8LPK2_9FUNG|nr:ribosylnicotinamide kinase [Coemansia interrupta]